ncbi:hypothetical protein SSX86_021656 [Deinandra increscens subsp. villosa]|uniref:Uncharacterized protein n=1 Tax=Deinandra increscens subsp. villosa TaxID=3103831 RepID=A0AAP0GSK6_9ASTR
MSIIEMAKLLMNRDQSLSVNVLLINPPYSVAPLTAYVASLAKNIIERIRFTQLPQDQTPPKLDPKAFMTSMRDGGSKFCYPMPMKFFPAAYQIHDGLNFLIDSLPKVREAKGIMVNTFLELETHAIMSFLDTNHPLLYPVGPILNLDGVAGKTDDEDVFRWLDVQPPSSMVVVCFGSMGSFNEVQVKEMACGLERCGHRFVWSLCLPPPQEQSLHMHDDDPRVLLPNGFLKRTMGIGKVIGWAPHVALLAHEAVGVFVSYCGWNSMLESLWFGVPTATWPLYAEQQLNAFQMVVDLRLAVDLKMDNKMDMFNPHTNKVIVTAEEVDVGIRRLMEDNEIRAKVKEMSKLSRATVAKGGSSYTSVDYLVKEIKGLEAEQFDHGSDALLKDEFSLCGLPALQVSAYI